jgi:ABC-type sulfate transport system permease subunit
MKKEYKYFVIEIIFGGLMGFFFLHPLSMLITGGVEALVFCFKDNMHHLTHSSMALFFTLIGIFLATVTAISRIRIRKKNILLERQNQEIEETKAMLTQLNVGSEFKFTLPKVNSINGL